ncbi:MAG: hypothetical protein K2O81_02215, partial [Clostridia bacterium]|nr:hypothetical protein [Clostridia bacterium]
MKKTKKALLAAIACVAALAGAVGLAACNKGGDGSARHEHEWSAWSVESGNVPAAEVGGKATRECSGEGDCNAAASDKEYALPALSDTAYTVTGDTAQVGVAGTGKYKYDKDGVTVEFTAATPAKPHVHEGGVWTVADENKPTADKKGKA